MKKITLSLLILMSIKSFAQTDTSTITVVLPVKAVVLYGDYISNFSSVWADRRLPDALSLLIGSGTQVDSLVTVKTTAYKFSNYILYLLNYPYGTISTFARSVLNNSPSIPGYTALTTQITTISNGNTYQKLAAQYIISRYTDYSADQTAQYNRMFTNGIYFIQH